MNNELFLKQIQALVSDENDYYISKLANVSAAINEYLDRLNWVGFYLIKNDELVLGPFQGKVACTRIQVGKGVCGTSVIKKETLRVDNVHLFEGHIACDSASNSEIVVPIIKNDRVLGVLDIDSPEYHRFDEFDQSMLEKLVQLIEKYVF